MSKHNYSQYSNSKKKGNDTAKVESISEIPVTTQNNVYVSDEFVPETPEVKMAVETVETVTLPKTVKGTVSNCAKLNVREKPSLTAEVVCVLDAMSEIEIDVAKSTAEWFYICTATGAEGYCMKKFVEACL